MEKAPEAVRTNATHPIYYVPVGPRARRRKEFRRHGEYYNEASALREWRD